MADGNGPQVGGAGAAAAAASTHPAATAAVAEFLTGSTVITPALAGMLTMMATNVIATVVGLPSGEAYLGLGVSLLIALLIGVKNEPIMWRRTSVLFLNSVIVYSIAFGYSELTARPSRQPQHALVTPPASIPATPSHSTLFSEDKPDLRLVDADDWRVPRPWQGIRNSAAFPEIRVAQLLAGSAVATDASSSSDQGSTADPAKIIDQLKEENERLRSELDQLRARQPQPAGAKPIEEQARDALVELQRQAAEIQRQTAEVRQRQEAEAKRQAEEAQRTAAELEKAKQQAAEAQRQAEAVQRAVNEATSSRIKELNGIFRAWKF